MTNNTAWAAGRGVGLTWTSCFNTGDLASIPSGSSVMSSVADIANGTALDQFADVAFELAIASTTLTAGASLALCIYDKFQIDGSNNYYGDNALPSGTQKAYLASYGLASAVSMTITGVAQTVITGKFRQVILPPNTFRFALISSLGVTLGAGTQYVSYITYNQALNS